MSLERQERESYEEYQARLLQEKNQPKTPHKPLERKEGESDADWAKRQAKDREGQPPVLLQDRNESNEAFARRQSAAIMDTYGKTVEKSVEDKEVEKSKSMKTESKPEVKPSYKPMAEKRK